MVMEVIYTGPNMLYKIMIKRVYTSLIKYIYCITNALNMCFWRLSYLPHSWYQWTVVNASFRAHNFSFFIYIYQQQCASCGWRLTVVLQKQRDALHIVSSFHGKSKQNCKSMDDDKKTSSIHTSKRHKKSSLSSVLLCSKLKPT